MNRSTLMLFLLVLLIGIFTKLPVKNVSASTFVIPTLPTLPAFPTPPTYPPCFPFCTTTTISPTPSSTPAPTPTTSPSLSPTPTPSLAPTPVSTSSSSLYWGAFVGSQPYNLTDITTFENMTQKGMSAVLWYQSFGVTDGTQNFEPAWMNTVRNHGSIPFVTLEPWNYTQGVNQQKYRLINIINGNFDTYLTKWATDAKNWGQPFFFRFAHEMNGNWYPWSEQVNRNSAGQYVKAWQHVHDIFTKVGATNVTWVWCPNIAYSGSTPLQGLYPGDNYVDWTCMDGYNWGTNQSSGWQTFSQVFSQSYAQIVQLSSKPMMIGETSSAEQGGSKANWITDAYGNGIAALPNIKMIVWFNQNNPPDWRIQSSLSAQNAFKTAISNSEYTTNSFSSLSSPIPLP